jgi:hypothetical protein
MQNWKPWSQSTGPKTEAGKNTAKMNAYKHGERDAQMRKLAQNFIDLKRKLSQLIDAHLWG